MMNQENLASHSWWRKRNLWKIGFFLLLLALEICREVIVIQADSEARPNVRFFLFNSGNYTHATGVWKRSDKNEKMSAAALSLECNADRRECIFVDTQMHRLDVFAPNVSVFPAIFTNDSITFDDDRADCANLSFRIDLKLKRVNAMRVSKPSLTGNDMCGKMEGRMDLTLGDSLDDMIVHPESDHFLPVLSVLKMVLGD